jgi:hypothetical protein
MFELPAGAKIADVQDRYTRDDLVHLTREHVDAILGLILGIPDGCVTFEPVDPAADDPYAATEEEKHVPWTLGHVIVHTTASAEERAAHGSLLARGAEVKGRARYEVPWPSVTTLGQLVHRLEESRRIRLAYLDAWPDNPHLDNVYNHSRYVELFGLLNAVGITLMGLHHEVEHVGQMADIVRQARAAVG